VASTPQQMKFRYEKQANALLRGQGLAPVGPIGLIGRIKRNGIAKSARRARRTAWFAAQTKFRMLPSDERRAIIGKFKAERLADPDLRWGEFLLAAVQ